jgi:hypothetical protein
MRESEAAALVARLASAFPSDEMPRSSVATYSRFLLPFAVEVVEEGIDRTIVGWRSWRIPPIALLLYECRIVQEDRAMTRGLPEGTPSEEDKALGLALVRKFLGKRGRGRHIEAESGPPSSPAPSPGGEEA